MPGGAPRLRAQGGAGGAWVPRAFPPTGPRKGDPTRSRSPSSKPGGGRPGGGAGRGARVTPGGRPAPRRRAAVRSAPPCSGARCPRRCGSSSPGRAGPDRAAVRGPGRRAETSDSRCGSGKAAAPGVPGRDLKGPSLTPALGPCAQGGGIWGDPGLGPERASFLVLPLFLFLERDPCPNTRTEEKWRPRDPVGSAPKGRVSREQEWRTGKSPWGEEVGSVGGACSSGPPSQVPQWLRFLGSAMQEPRLGGQIWGSPRVVRPSCARLDKFLNLSL